MKVIKILIPIPSYGFDTTEVAIPWKLLSENNFEIFFATPNGEIGITDQSMLHGTKLGVWKSVLMARKDAVEAHNELIKTTNFRNPLKYSELKETDFDALLLPGGHDKAVKEYLESTILQNFVVDFFNANKPIAAVCHGVVLAARSINPKTGKSVLHNFKTTSLLKSQELLAYNLTRLWLKDYYLTYPEITVEDEVIAVLSDSKNFIKGSKPVLRDDMKHLNRGFAVTCENYVSARWPGDIYTFSLEFIKLIKSTMPKKYIIALDQGTTSSRSVLFDENGEQIAIEQQEFEQIFLHSGWVEHDPQEILDSQLNTFKNLLKNNNIDAKSIVGIGITNQRETTVIWNKTTGKTIYNAIVWQDKRTAFICEELKKNGLEDYVKTTTGLVIDSYFSGTKIKWILDNVDNARALAEKGELLFGTIDTWLLWNLTNGKVHATDYSNASRTMLFNINTLEWDDKLLKALDIPKSMLPKVHPSSYHFGNFEVDNHQIPIAGIAGDQQAALFGQACFEKGEAKNTYGTGCFLLMNTGTTPQYSKNGLLTTIAWGIDNKVYYALEGSVFIAGAAIQWLRDGLQLIATAEESETIAKQLTDDNPVYVVPAFAGLGAPYWDMYARGAIFGLTRDTGKEHLIKATLDSLAYQSKDLINAMQEDCKIQLTSLKVDGGASANNYLMQFQADILNCTVNRPKNIESTALGAAYLAGISVGLWRQEDILKTKNIEHTFTPTMEESKREKLYKGWQKAVKRTMNWEDE